MVTEFFIFRHGETDWNREMRFQGHTDIPLNNSGIEQARKLLETIRPCGLDAFVSSDLSRARVTAEILNEELKLPFVTTQALRECFMGDPEGMLRSEMFKVYGEAAWERWLSINPEDHEFCFPNGEPKNVHLLRLKTYLEDFSRNNPHYKRIGVSTHGGSLRRLIHNCEGSPMEPVPMPNCALYQVRFDHVSLKWSYSRRVE